jgi:ABC-2 type transport system permease protein
MFVVFKKEVSTYYSTPFGFIFMGIFLLLSGIMFFTYNLLGGGGDLNGLFGLLSNISFMIFPILTIKLFTDERKAGTEQLLLTSRLTPSQIVLGKYFAAVFVFVASLAATLVYVLILKMYGFPDLKAIAASYLGFLLLGMAFIAVSTFTSVIADNYVTAAIASFGALVGFVLIGVFSRSVQTPVISDILSALAITRQYDAFIKGVFSLGPIAYFIGFIVIFITLSVFSFEGRRFS